MLIFSFFLFTFLFSNVKMYIINTQKKRGIVMKISKSLKRKRRADARTVGIVICIIVIIAALVVVFWPTNTTKNTQESQVASQNTNTNSNNTQVAKQNTNTIANTIINDIATNTIADNSITNTTTNVTTNTATVTTNSNKVQNTTANTTANTNTNTTNNNQTTSQTNQQTQTNTNTTNVNFEVINWGKGQIDENRAKEMAVAQFEKLGEKTSKDQLQVYPLERNDGKYYFYIKSSKNTCEIRKEDGTITRVNAKVVNQ